jgi:hypothetical protein
MTTKMLRNEHLFCGILTSVPETNTIDYKTLYPQFDSPLSHDDCGEKCAPYNEYGIPFCCDIRQAVPTVYKSEWKYLKENTDLWHIWDDGDPDDTNRLLAETPEEQVLVECKGHARCQRSFRSITCRAFPFYPYITCDGEFLGLSYYWQYEDRCWIISNLEVVTLNYRSQFMDTYNQLFKFYPQEMENFKHHSGVMRMVFSRRKRSIPLLHWNGKTYKITPANERLRIIDPESLPKHGSYYFAALMPFPDER